MPKISVADLEQLLESEDNEFVDRREILREKEHKNKFKEKIEGHSNE